jgi:hypothetical protein
MANVLKASKFIQLPKPLQTKLVRSSHVIPINDKFIPYFGSREKIILLYGSYGNGKSKFVAQDLIEKCRSDKYLKCFYGRKIYDEVRKSFFDELCTEIEERNLEHEFTYSRKDNSTMIITHKNGNKFIPFGASDAKNLKSIKDASHIICEEFDQFTDKDFGFLLSRLRTEKAQTQFYGMFNTEPLVENHWLRQTFFNDKIEHELKPLKIFGTYKDNYFIDHKDYLEKLKLIANGRDYILEAIANGMMGVTFNDNPFFYAYKKDLHYSYSSYQPTNEYFLDISFDFNITPCTALIGQYNRSTKTFNVFDLILTDINTIVGNSSLKSLCLKIKQKYIDTGLFVPYRIRVTGDASGRNGSADREINNTFYNTIREILKVPEQNFYVRKANLQHVTSAEVCNAVLTTIPINHFTIFDIPELDTDINSAYFDIKQTLDEAKKKHGLHIVDAFRYLIDFWFGMENKRFLKKFDEISYNITNIKKRIENE